MTEDTNLNENNDLRESGNESDDVLNAASTESADNTDFTIADGDSDSPEKNSSDEDIIYDDYDDPLSNAEAMDARLSEFTENEVHPFTSAKDRYDDLLSSAFTMLLVGFAGIILLFLVYQEVIPLNLNPRTSWLVYSVCGGVFIIFIISGVVSFIHSKNLKLEVIREGKLIDRIKEFASENITKDTLDEGVDLDARDEMLYFARADKIKDILMHEFEEADEALIAEITEEIYSSLYESAK